MSPSELDTKAPSVPPHPFKVGDKVWIWHRFGLRPIERAVVTSLPIDHTGRFQVERSGGWREWCSSDELLFDTSVWRHAHKGGLESLKKARWYLDREIAAAEKAVEKAQEKKP
mgnify:CR=1 FL=1